MNTRPTRPELALGIMGNFDRKGNVHLTRRNSAKSRPRSAFSTADVDAGTDRALHATPARRQSRKMCANMSADKYEGKTYRAESGQWSWVVTWNDVEVVRGAGYPNEVEAMEAMEESIAELTQARH
jgi:hypothetical protein